MTEGADSDGFDRFWEAKARGDARRASEAKDHPLRQAFRRLRARLDRGGIINPVPLEEFREELRRFGPIEEPSPFHPFRRPPAKADWRDERNEAMILRDKPGLPPGPLDPSPCAHKRKSDEPNGYTECLDCGEKFERWASESTLVDAEPKHCFHLRAEYKRGMAYSVCPDCEQEIPRRRPSHWEGWGLPPRSTKSKPGEISPLNYDAERNPFTVRPHHRGWPDNFDPRERELGPVSTLPPPGPFELKTQDPRFNAGEPVTINGHRYVAEKTMLAGLERIRKALDEVKL